ncbi:MAG TPA: hypothetical protein VJM15_02530 [Sphingomicrobium sp.]|nr:hypothetical protein [Sphingomicrobium sp.]
MRAVLLVLILIVIAALVLIATGLVDINQIRGASAPEISTTDNGVVAKGGQAPAFDVETGSVKVGTQNATVTVPKIEVEPAGNTTQANAANAM